VYLHNAMMHCQEVLDQETSLDCILEDMKRLSAVWKSILLFVLETSSLLNLGVPLPMWSTIARHTMTSVWSAFWPDLIGKKTPVLKLGTVAWVISCWHLPTRSRTTRKKTDFISVSAITPSAFCPVHRVPTLFYKRGQRFRGISR